MSAQHTQGPWVIDEDDLRDDPDTVFSIGIWTDEEDPLMVAHVSAFSLHSEMVDGVEHVSAADPAPSHLSQAKANARLIAAAPELLDAADNALNTLIACCVSAGGVDDRKAILEAQQMLSAAIAKATGGEA